MYSMQKSEIKSLKKLFSGKVRDIYEVDKNSLLLVATDRLSAFDVVFNEPIPEKGRVLTQLSTFWFNKIKIVPNHLLDINPEDVVGDNERDQVIGRAVVVRKTKPLPVEAVVRGYLVGSGWNDYQKTGKVCGIELPVGLAQAAKLEQPIFTPATKEEIGKHDINISFAQMENVVGKELAIKVREISINIYQSAREYALTKNIIIADTKFEFGLDVDNNLIWIDEALTPDSSRYWPLKQYQTGISPPSFDKQFVRDYLLSIKWNQSPPAPTLPDNVINVLSNKYVEAFNLLTQAG